MHVHKITAIERFIRIEQSEGNGSISSAYCNIFDVMRKAEQENELDQDQESDLAELKADADRIQHVPYILNGELYKIVSQTGDNVTVRCCYCPPDRIYRGSVRSTGNFHMHIKRRHASLLGKLHEMKVKALGERRDRILKNRLIAKSRKKSTTPVANTVTISDSPSASEVPKSPQTRELKIKTVFQRHKQEHQEQEVAAAIRTSISICESSQDNSQASSKPSDLVVTEDDNNNNNAQNIPNLNISGINTLESNQNVDLTVALPAKKTVVLPTIVAMSRLLPYSLIKPEQQNQMTSEQPEAIDLSRTSSLQSDGTGEILVSHSLQNVQIEVTRAQELATFTNGPSREAFLHIESTLVDIKDELQTRNQIERERLLFDMAKFKYLHPNFNIDAAQ